MSVNFFQSNLLEDVEDLHGKQKERKDGLTVSPLIKWFCLRIKLNPSKIHDLDSGQHYLQLEKDDFIHNSFI